MLKHLSIRNIVLVEAAEIPFAEGLNVLTGETGAGKSILLDALGLVFGDRSDAGLLRPGASQASVTAEFMVAGRRDVVALMSELGLAPDDVLIIRRTLDGSGRSRAFINDTAVTVAALKQMAALLVEQHSQHDQRGLTDSAAHRDAMDRLAGASKERRATEAAFGEWRAAVAELDALKARVMQTERERVFLQHMVEELKALNPQAGEEEMLADTRARMQAQIKSQEHLVEAQGLLLQPDMTKQLVSAQRALAKVTLPDAAQQARLSEALERAWQEVAEVQAQLEALLESRPDEGKLELSEERLFALRAAARKYQTSVEGLAEEYASARQKLSELASQEEQEALIAKRVKETKAAYERAASALSEKRKAAAEPFVKAVMKELKPLKMEKAQIAVKFDTLAEEQWSAGGKERVTFEASANPGIPLAPIAEIASGGELSRMMLALKVVMRKAEQPGLYLFDEIDTGTGGAVADAIGARLKKLAEGGQVMVVTHAPQVAAQGNHHLLIAKRTAKGQTQTNVMPLDAKQRQDELARMLSGSEITDEARSAAKRLLQAAG